MASMAVAYRERGPPSPGVSVAVHGAVFVFPLQGDARPCGTQLAGALPDCVLPPRRALVCTNARTIICALAGVQQLCRTDSRHGRADVASDQSTGNRAPQR